MTLRAEQCSQRCASVGPSLVWSCRQRAQVGSNIARGFQVARGKSNLHLNGPKLHHVGPQRSSCAQVEANWPEYGASYAQVASCSATDIQVLPHSTAKSPLLFSLSYSHLFTGCRWYSSRSGSTMRNHLITSVPFLQAPRGCTVNWNAPRTLNFV